MKSPFHITYADLVKSCEDRLLWMQRNHPRMILTGQIKSDVAQRAQEIEKKKIVLFKRGQKDPQINLWDEFNKSK